MIPFSVIVRNELTQSPTKVALPEENHSVKAFALDGSHKPLGVRVAVRRLKRGPHDPYPGLMQRLANRRAPLLVSVANQHAVSRQDAVIGRDHRASDLAHEVIIRIRSTADNMYPPRGGVDD